ncbi:MAG: right-handed parallel beta-helix repeat-containing protein, partial [Candidatus Binatia bacterium]
QVLTATSGTAATWQAVSGGDPAGFITLDPADQATAGTAINDAIATLPIGGGTILVPAGSWIIDTPILINKNGIILKGVSSLASELEYDPAVITTAIRMADTTQRFVAIEDLMIDSTGSSGGTAIDASYFVNSIIRGVRIGLGSTAPQIGIAFNALGTYYNIVRDCSIRVAGVGSVGILIDNTSNSNQIDNIRFYGDANTVGVYIDAHTTTITHIDCEATMAIAVHVDNDGHNTTLVGPYIESVDVGVQLEAGVEGFACFGGFISDCDVSNISDLGAKDPVFAGVWRQYESYTSIPEPPFKRVTQVMKDAGVATITSLGLAAPTLTATVSNGDDSSGALLNHATAAVVNDVSGVISPFNQVRRDWEPRIDMRVKTGADITGIRILAGLFDESPDDVPV